MCRTVGKLARNVSAANLSFSFAQRTLAPLCWNALANPPMAANRQPTVTSRAWPSGGLVLRADADTSALGTDGSFLRLLVMVGKG